MPKPKSRATKSAPVVTDPAAVEPMTASAVIEPVTATTVVEPVSATPAVEPLIEARTCPFCGAKLDPALPDECPRCDWVPGAPETPEEEARAGTPRDLAAMIMSVVPGLGHIYKGYKLVGALLFAGGVLAIAICSVIATATMGLGLLLIPLFWVGMMLHVYWLEDRAVPPA